jgi:transcriptional regulator
MYIPDAFTVDDDPTIDAFIQRYDFATMVTAAPAGLLVSHVPVMARREAARLVIVGHVARGNSHWCAMDGAINGLAIFHGPHSYISPTWYANSPAVPTWNYAVVHAHGKPRFRDDRPFIETVVDDLANRFEGERGEPWRFRDQPSDFRDKMLAAIVGFEMPVLKIEAKFKLGQNRRADDRAGMVAGLEREGSPEGIALAMFMRARQERAPE